MSGLVFSPHIGKPLSQCTKRKRPEGKRQQQQRCRFRFSLRAAPFRSPFGRKPKLDSTADLARVKNETFRRSSKCVRLWNVCPFCSRAFSRLTGESSAGINVDTRKITIPRVYATAGLDDKPCELHLSGTGRFFLRSHWRKDCPLRPSLEKVLTEARTLAPDELPRLLGDLEEIRAVALARIAAPAVEARPDELLTVEQAAKRLSLSKDYLYRHSRRLPFAKRIGRKLLFSSNGLDAYLRKSR